MEFDPKLVGEWVTIWNSYDLNQVLRLFLDDDRVTYFSSEKEGAVKGFEALMEHHRGFGFIEGGKTSPNKLWLEDIDIASFENSTVVTAIWFFKRGGSGNVQKGPVTLVYVPADDGFRIAHANFSNY
jgi:ketosteroid isomerase-like protein